MSHNFKVCRREKATINSATLIYYIYNDPLSTDSGLGDFVAIHRRNYVALIQLELQLSRFAWKVDKKCSTLGENVLAQKDKMSWKCLILK